MWWMVISTPFGDCCCISLLISNQKKPKHNVNQQFIESWKLIQPINKAHWLTQWGLGHGKQLKPPDRWMDKTGLTEHLSAAFFLSLAWSSSQGCFLLLRGFLPAQPVCCWSKFSISNMLLWCFSLLLVRRLVLLLSVWKGCWEPSQALRKHRNCKRLCSASVSSFSCGIGKRAGYDVQL